MTDFAELAMEGVPLVTEHYDKVYDPVKNKTKQGVNKIKKMRYDRNGGYESESDYEEIDRYGPPQRSQTDRRRRSPRDDLDDRRRSRRGGEVVEERYAYSKGNGRARSLGRQRGSRRDYSDSESSLSPPRRERRKSLGEKALVALGLGGAAAGAEVSKDRDRRRRSRPRRRGSTPSSDSEGYYVRKNPRSRGPPTSSGGGYGDDRTPDRYKPAGYIRGPDGGDSERGGGGGQEIARRNNQSTVGPRSNAGGRSQSRGKKSGSSSESSDVCSSSEDDRRTKKMKGKEYLTAGLAAVATIHAAHNVYASMEARDKRHLDVMRGEITAEEAKKKKNKARLQDAAAIGIAALGIKGAYSEWQEVQENRHELAEQNEERKKRHEKRMKKAQKSVGGGGGGGGGGGSQYGRSRSEGPSRRQRDRS